MIIGLVNTVPGNPLPLELYTEKEQIQAEVQVVILDHLFQVLPTPPFSDADKQAAAQEVYQYVWAQSNAGSFTHSTAV